MIKKIILLLSFSLIITPQEESWFAQIYNKVKTIIKGEYTPSELSTLTAKEIFHLAIEKNSLPLVQESLNRGLDLDKTDNINCTPLHYAASLKDPAIAQLLLLAGANPTLQIRPEGFTPGQLALHANNIETAAVIYDASHEKYHTFPLAFHAIELNNRKALEYCLSYQDINQVYKVKVGDNYYYETCLFFAAYKEVPKMVQFLVSQKEIDLEVPNSEDETPLEAALLLEKETTVHIIVEAYRARNISFEKVANKAERRKVQSILKNANNTLSKNDEGFGAPLNPPPVYID